jgi:hypothetical protein
MKKYVHWNNTLNVAETYAKEDYDRTIDKVLISQNIQMNKINSRTSELFEFNNIWFIILFVLFVFISLYSIL